MEEITKTLVCVYVLEIVRNIAKVNVHKKKVAPDALEYYSPFAVRKE